jgi:hypothetical protein
MNHNGAFCQEQETMANEYIHRLPAMLDGMDVILAFTW